GRYLEIAVAGLKAAPKLDLSRLVDNQTFISIDLRRLLLREPEVARRYMDRMVAALASRAVLPTIGRVFSFDSLRDAYGLLSQRDSIGKVVINIPAEEAVVGPVVGGPAVKAPEATPSTSPRHKSGPGSAPLASAPPALEPIAIIGMAGRFPDADDLDAFWENLQRGHDAVREIPADRWDVHTFFDPDPDRLDRTYCRWGGVLRDVDRFDPHFFNMSRREAELCEPQQRLFLEESWKALEDAGYVGDRASGLSCGVFVGVASGDYTLVLEQAGMNRAPQAMAGNETSIIPARIAYFLNLKGPALAVNTACSSSLVSVHLACQSLWTGTSRMALAGGVFVITTPAFHVLTSNARMLSPTGRCRAFDQAADGFVPGEGVGVVVLKPLGDALRDGDRIHGVIRATGINQDGRTNGITAPSARSQAELLRSVYEMAGISPRTIDYIETHGTGTRLGDPVEIDALTDAFRHHTLDTGFCAVGSVKSSIGHAATAAGVASLLKVLLSLKHRALPPTLHVTRENEHIDFASSPFVVNRALRPWIREDGPRRAAVSSFGFSGTNAHLVVEEAPQPPIPPVKAPAWLFPLSGRDGAAVERAAAALLRWSRGPGREVPLADIAFTLQRRRAHFEHRLAVVAADRAGLEQGLEAATRGERREGLIRGASGKDARPMQNLLELAGRQLVQALASSAGDPDAYTQALSAWAELYAAGGAPPWEHLPAGRLASLPTYPFARERCWPDPSGTTPSGTHPFQLAADPHLGLLEGAQVLRARISPEEPVLADHRIGGRILLPGVAALELVLEAISQVMPGQPCTLEQVYWLRPLEAGPDGLSAHVIVQPEDGALAFRIQTGGPSEPVVHVQGIARLEAPLIDPAEPVIAVPSDVRGLDGEAFYAGLKRASLDYGPWFQCLRDLRTGEGEAIAKLELPPERRAELSRFHLHPALADSALQAVFGLASRNAQGGAGVAFSVDRVVVAGRLTASALARVQEVEPGLFHVAIADSAGRVQVMLEGVGVRKLASAPEAPAFAPVWEPIADGVALADLSGPALLLLHEGADRLALDDLRDVRVRRLPAAADPR
ncbi:MAG TPA: beta-ketoacyl synthase N-terminal-like domain-containing protein, partial [Candidatus Nanopelagicales bacterium]|nr:beta-ketoacyl synthase N-terminal-like domain-containing protein [Candidatus Nanopelagicales bacterium]